MARCLKHITGSSQAVTMLNRFSDAMSESQLEEVETAVAEKHLHESEHGEVIPANIVPSSFITLCQVWLWPRGQICFMKVRVVR